MLKIGDFSKLGEISIKTLHHYDQMGLLTPIAIDPDSGYRYYSVKQLPRLNRILALKDLGLSLEQIRILLNENVSFEQMQGMLRLKQAELQQNIQEQQQKLMRVSMRLNQIEKEGIMPNYDVIIKKVEPIWVVSIREMLPSYYAIGSLYDELEQFLRSAGVKKWGYSLGIWHDPGYKESEVDSEAAIAIDAPIAGSDRIKVYELPGCDLAASLVHHGSYKGFREAYQNLISWIENNGYQIIGANREIYLESGPDPDNESYVTEIMFPVQKV
ncbi:MerR family transcriptional regulator [Pseudanabaena sp. PCC 6802]|uniref:MerR family transcriptional regulator n=1 Tax=Pseudanabaena sp. PCC 6802 TaxID=118173 RepID=UPI0003466F1A|nr:MerR family transcriptional regulator [Pseudanabaena sp. PCC 6802]